MIYAMRFRVLLSISFFLVFPFGYLKEAYADQAGKFRVASAKTNKNRRSVGSILYENCERIGTTPHYMRPTISSQQRIK